MDKMIYERMLQNAVVERFNLYLVALVQNGKSNEQILNLHLDDDDNLITAEYLDSYIRPLAEEYESIHEIVKRRVGEPRLQEMGIVGFNNPFILIEKN